MKESNSDIIPYNPEDMRKLDSGCYLNEKTGYYEIWWAENDDDEESVLMARVKYEYDIGPALLETIDYWTGRYDYFLESINYH